MDNAIRVRNRFALQLAYSDDTKGVRNRFALQLAYSVPDTFVFPVAGWLLRGFKFEVSKCSSGASSFNFGVDRLEFATCIIDPHLPVDSSLFCIHAA